MFRNLTCLGVKHIKKKVTTKCLEKCLDSKHIFYSVSSQNLGPFRMSNFRSSFSTLSTSPVIPCQAGLYLKGDEEQEQVGGLVLSKVRNETKI
jgi:hypothetical protein